jgi:uncharacterized protein (DUF427 family)
VVVFGGETIADTTSGYRVLETSQPPSYYIPPDDVDAGFIERAVGHTFCEWKGQATYWTIRVGDRVAERAAWSYPSPTPRFEPIRDHLAFYPQRVDSCSVDDEQVRPNAGDFYGGWVTSRVVGPFKGEPGTAHW